MRFHLGEDERGRDNYAIPQYAVLGGSDTGPCLGSPCPSPDVRAEIERFRLVLRSAKIRSRIVRTRSGDVFMLKVWCVVHSRDFTAAADLATAWLAANQDTTRYVHDADLAEPQPEPRPEPTPADPQLKLFS